MTYKFAATYCSQCGAELGPGDSGVSRCADHWYDWCERRRRRQIAADDRLLDLQLERSWTAKQSQGAEDER